MHPLHVLHTIHHHFPLLAFVSSRGKSMWWEGEIQCIELKGTFSLTFFWWEKNQVLGGQDTMHKTIGYIFPS